MEPGQIVIAYSKGAHHERRRVVARVESLRDGTAVIRCWMGLAPFRNASVRWSHTPKSIPLSDVVREATPREAAIGMALS